MAVPLESIRHVMNFSVWDAVMTAVATIQFAFTSYCTAAATALEWISLRFGA